MIDQKVLECPLILLGGEEPALRNRALRTLLDQGGEDDFDRQGFEADESTPIEWLAAAGTAPFLSDRRTVVVRHLLRFDFDPDEPLSLKGLPNSARLVLVADDETGDENKQKRLQTVYKKWAKLVKDAKGLALDFETKPEAVRSQVHAEVLGRGMKISPKALDTLVEMTGGNLSRCLEEIEKLALFAGQDGEIKESHVIEVVVPSREWNIFKLSNAIIAGQAGEALNQLNILAASTTKIEDFAFKTIFPQLSRQFRLLWQARICIEAKTNPGNAPESVSRLFPADMSLAKQSPGAQGAIMRNAQKVRFDGLRRCLRIVADADARMKGLLDGYSSRETLERMVLEMIEAVRV